MAAALAFPLAPLTERPLGARNGQRPRAERLHTRPAPAPRCRRTAAVYWRRRFVAVALGLGLVVVAGQASAALGGSSLAPVERRPQAESVIVEPGDTLWSIASRLAPESDPREVVDALVEARGSAALLPGETITWLDD